MDQVIQIVGALLILAAFAAVQFERMRPDSRLYLALNLVGSAILAVLAVARLPVGLRPARGRLGDRLRAGGATLRPCGRALSSMLAAARAARRGGSSRARGPRRRRPAQSVGAVRRRLDAGVAQGRDVLEGEQVLAGFDQGAAQFRAPLADRVVEDRLQRAVLAQQLGRGLRADALGARAGRRRGRRAGR